MDGLLTAVYLVSLKLRAVNIFISIRLLFDFPEKSLRELQ